MSDSDCVEFLRWALPHLRMRWAGYRRVRRQVCKRVARRLRELGLPDAAAYRAHLETHPTEWRHLDALCRIPISRFYRDRAVFEALGEVVLPDLARLARARADGELRCWSAGCASGEEAYTLVILWESRVRPGFPDLRLRVTATDADEGLLERARLGCFRWSSLKELPAKWLATACERTNDRYSVLPRLRERIEFRREDVRRRVPEGFFHLVLCRNLVFTYFDFDLQRETLPRIGGALLSGGALVIGAHESLPRDAAGFSVWMAHRGIYRRRAGSEPGRAEDAAPA